MELDQHISYFTLHCNLETDGKAWAFLNEFMCIGKNKNGYFVCLTSTLPIELEVTNGGATLEIVKEHLLFAGRRPAAQSTLQFTVKAWQAQAVIELKREKTGCLLLPNLHVPELDTDRNNILELVKRALPEVRAEWGTETLLQKLKKPLPERSQSMYWLEKFPQDWIILFSGSLTLSSASIESNQYAKESIDFDVNISDCFKDGNQSSIQQISLYQLEDDNYEEATCLALSLEVEINFAELSLILRASYAPKTLGGERQSSELKVRFSADNLDATNPKPEQLIGTDRLCLSNLNETEDKFQFINLQIDGQNFSDATSEKFDKDIGISVRLAPYLSRR